MATKPKSRICTGCKVRRQAASFATPRARVCNICKRKGARRASRSLRVRQTYGITVHEADEILKVQGGVCAGCLGTRRYHLHVDHDHKVEKAQLAEGKSAQSAARASVRGRLCARCNKILRDSRDNPDLLRRLADYLDSPPAKEVLQ